MFESLVTGNNVPQQREKSVVDFRLKLKIVKAKAASFFSVGNSEQTSPTPDLQGLNDVNLIPQKNDEDNLVTKENRTRSEIWLEKRLKVAEEEAQLTSVVTNLTFSGNNNSNWIIKTRDGRSMEIDPYDLFQKYFPDIKEDRKIS